MSIRSSTYPSTERYLRIGANEPPLKTALSEKIGMIVPNSD